jgi:hypothetical protein
MHRVRAGRGCAQGLLDTVPDAVVERNSVLPEKEAGTRPRAWESKTRSPGCSRGATLDRALYHGDRVRAVRSRGSTADDLTSSGRTPRIHDSQPGCAWAPRSATVVPANRNCTVRPENSRIAPRRRSRVSRSVLRPARLQAAHRGRIVGRSTRMVSCCAVMVTVWPFRSAVTSPTTSSAVGAGLTPALLRAPAP